MSAAQPPPVYVSEPEYEQLLNLACASAGRGADILSHELARAIVVRPDEPVGAFVRLHSVVEYTDALTGKTRRVQVVPPEEADIDQGKLSVLTPVGASLIGLRSGAAIGMTTDDGRPHVLEIRAVEGGR